MFLQSLTSKISYSFSGLVASMGMLELNSWALLVGMVLGFATFVVNWIYKHKSYKLELSKRSYESNSST